MKYNMLRNAVLASLILCAPLANAARNNTSMGDDNGKPFQELNAIIEENRALIDANAADIENLRGMGDAIDEAIALLEAELGELGGRVALTEEGIAALQDRADAMDESTEALSLELERLRADHEADVETINAAIADANARIDQLRRDLRLLARTLNDQLDALSSDVSFNTIAIDILLVELTSTTATAMANMMAIEDLDAQVLDLEGRVAANESDIAALQVFHQSNALQFSGVRTNLPLAEAEGWSICYQKTFRDADTSIASNIAGNCDKANIMLACRLTGSDTLAIAAHAPRGDVFFETGTGNDTHNANGVDWYYNSSYSMGFAHENDGVTRENCDTATGSFPGERVCYDTQGGRGWRCGEATGLNFDLSRTWEQVVLEAD